MSSDLSSKHCEACEGIGASLTAEQVNALKPQLNARWEVSEDNKSIHRAFSLNTFMKPWPL